MSIRICTAPRVDMGRTAGVSVNSTLNNRSILLGAITLGPVMAIAAFLALGCSRSELDLEGYLPDSGISPDANAHDSKLDSGILDSKQDSYMPDASLDSMPVDSNLDSHIPDVISDAIQDSNDADAPVCVPVSNPSILNVPDAYDTVQKAIDAAKSGDIVQIKEGDYVTDQGITLKNCVHIKGAGIDKTNIIQDVSLNPADCFVTGAIGNSIEGVSLKRKNNSDPYADDGCITLTDGLMQIKKSRFNLTGRGNSQVTIEDGIITILNLGGATYADIKNSTIKWIWFTDNSGGKLRGNSITGMSDLLNVPGYLEGVIIRDAANPDLGTSADPGNNSFLNQSMHCANGALIYVSSIDNETPAMISARGNSYEGQYDTNCPSPLPATYGTYEDMVANPNPNPSSEKSKVKTVMGYVDYTGFKKIQ